MRRERRRRWSAALWIGGPAVVVGLLGLVLWARRPDRAPSLLPGGLPGAASSARSSQASEDQSPLPGARDPEAWEHDAGRDRHWNPHHGHWHQGPPPPPEGRVATPPPSRSRTSQESNPSIPNPEPWQYDAVNDLYFDPNHGHWHSGEPPPPGERDAAAPQGRPPVGNPNLPDPLPWQYDPVSDRHFNPEHGHWHQGPPPAQRDTQ
jgi:hypothetical protein